MHVVHYVLGFYFYTAVGPTAMLHLNQDSHEPTNYPISMNWRYAVALVVFVWASYHQYTCHQILADLRRSNSTNNFSSQRNNVADTHPPKPSQTLRVGIPHGDWFALVSCPHYLAEILIYCSLLVVQAGSLTMLLPCSFVAFVLGLSARQMHSWYLDKFDDYPKNRKRIIPYIF
jgi:3-oxo-5-alpha-steroid 4-dehydrogenase 3